MHTPMHAHSPPSPPQKSTTKYGNEHEAIAVYSMMRAVQKFCPIYTLCVGNAFGEAALLLAAGSKVRSLGRLGFELLMQFFVAWRGRVQKISWLCALAGGG